MSAAIKRDGKRRSERIRRKKLALIKNAHRLGDEEGIDVAVIVCQQGQYYLAICTEQPSWLPDITQIARQLR